MKTVPTMLQSAVLWVLVLFCCGIVLFILEGRDDV
jgi:hypothetical protein